MANKSAAYADTQSFDNINNNLDILRGQINQVWSGGAAKTFDTNYSKVIAAMEETSTSISIFNIALEKLEIYKENKIEIEALETKIKNEKANPSLKTTESYTFLGIPRTRTVYVVNESLINGWQAEIATITAENEALKAEIIALLNQIVPLGSNANKVNYKPGEEDYITDDLVNNEFITGNLLPKNNSDIAHRGIRKGGMTDNSADAFILAGESGFWGCEADIRFDQNGTLVCSHNTVENGQNPTTFEQYLDICKQYGMTAIIDLKYERGVGPADEYLSPSVIKAIQDKGMIDSCVIQTNNHTDIPYIRQTSQDARIWYLTDVISDNNFKLISENGVECVNIRQGDSNVYQIKKLTDAGIDVCVWNVFGETTKQRLLNNGATYVMSDNVLGITPYQEGEKDFNNIAN